MKKSQNIINTMNNYIPPTFFSKDIIQTFKKQFPKSVFILANGGPLHSGSNSSIAYQSENLQIIRIEKSNTILSSKQFQKRCLKCYQSVDKKLKNSQKTKLLAQRFSQEFPKLNFSILLSQTPFVWSAIEQSKHYELKENGQQLLVIFA